MPQAAGRAHLFDLIIPSVDLTHRNGPFFKGNESQIVSLAARKTNAIHGMAVRFKKGETRFWGQPAFHDVTKNRGLEREWCQLLTF